MEETAHAPRLPTRVAQVDGCAIHHVDEGDGPPLVLLHGLAGSLGWFAPVLGPLAARFRVVALDLPGFGRSGKPDAPYTIPWMAAKVLRLLDDKGIERAHLVGNSLGGQIALAIALGQPARVERLVLAAPAGVTEWPALVLGMARLLDVAGGSGGGALAVPRVPEAMLALAFRAVFPGGGEPKRGPLARSRLADRFTRGYARAVASPDYPLASRAALRALRGSLAHPLGGACSSLRVPTLVIWGARDRILPVAGARLLRRNIAGAELLVYPDSGHCPMLDAPTRFTRDVTRFLDGHPTGV